MLMKQINNNLIINIQVSITKLTNRRRKYRKDIQATHNEDNCGEDNLIN